ncbi:hypothetical protein B0H16DRAFT_1898472 [Mycena metata]|uniref:Uncharacterized protein n=1 Tax=Mycena metata TaxID=1033252 RepID=A0AAD7HAN8_9AGAR|nr:hypothetical protein B0H16DRAFT_1898472 [Mycena metata]
MKKLDKVFVEVSVAGLLGLLPPEDTQTVISTLALRQTPSKTRPPHLATADSRLLPATASATSTSTSTTPTADKTELAPRPAVSPVLRRCAARGRGSSAKTSGIGTASSNRVNGTRANSRHSSHSSLAWQAHRFPLRMDLLHLNRNHNRNPRRYKDNNSSSTRADPEWTWVWVQGRANGPARLQGSSTPRLSPCTRYRRSRLRLRLGARAPVRVAGVCECKNRPDVDAARRVRDVACIAALKPTRILLNWYPQLAQSLTTGAFTRSKLDTGGLTGSASSGTQFHHPTILLSLSFYRALFCDKTALVLQILEEEHEFQIATGVSHYTGALCGP